MNIKAYTNFLEGLRIIAQVAEDQQVTGPQVIIEPMEPAIQKAVDLLRKMDPNYFSRVRKVVVSTSGGNYGFVESGKDKDPSIININVNRIKNESKSSSFADVVMAAAVVIAHERGHVLSYDPEQGFVGGESPAEAEEQRVSNWIKNNSHLLEGLA